jgi:sugar (pentulose or hexulose) kinase
LSASLGIDVGSTNVKAALVSPEGDLVAWAQRPLATVRDGDRAEQDAEALWDAVVDAVGELTQGRPAVATVGVCSQYSSIVPVGADLRPVAPMAMYWDQRGTDHSWAILERHEDAVEAFVDVHGIPPIGSGLSLGHLLHFQLDRPEVHAATAHYLEPMDFVVARLTGRVAATQATMFMAQVVDNRSVGTTAYDERLVDLAGVDLDRLPPLVGLDEVVGPVRGVEGLDGASVRVGMNDSAAGALAAGVYADGRGGLAVGTTAVLLDTVADKRVDLQAELVSMPSSVPGRYLAWAENGIAGRAVEHGLGLLGASFAELEAALAVGEPSSNGCLFLPWLTGSIAPKGDRNARGGWVGLSLDTTRDDLLRSMVEGTAHNLAWLLPAVERFTGQEITSLGFFGGAGRSPGWAQVLADVLGRPVATLADPEVAVAAAVARNAQGAPPDAAPALAATHEPRSDRTTVYQDAQARFEATFHALFP